MNKIKIIGLALVALLVCQSTYAQSNKEYKISMSSGKLIVKELDEVEFIGYSGNEVQITNLDLDQEASDRAEGLRLINGLGLEDNTGIGLSVTKEGNNTVINQIARNGGGEFKIKVPKGVIIVYEHSSVHGSDVMFRDIENEIEVTTNHNDVRLENVTGPMTVNTVHGDIEGVFKSVNQSNPISIVSSHGDIDLGIPASTKANLKINTGWGEIYSDLDIAIEKTDDMKRYGANKVRGSINGGGVSFTVESAHGSIYLRKK